MVEFDGDLLYKQWSCAFEKYGNSLDMREQVNGKSQNCNKESML